MRIAGGKIPGLRHIVHQVSIAQTSGKVFDAIIKADHAGQGRCAFNGLRAVDRGIPVQNEALEASLGNVLYDRKGTLGLRAIFHYDVLQLRPQKIFDQFLLVRFHFDEVRQNP